MAKPNKPLKRSAVTIEGNTPIVLEKSAIGRPREWTEERIEKKRIALDKWMDDPKNYYVLAFLNKEGLHAGHIERFCEYSPLFRESYARAMKIQEERLVDLAVSRKGDGNFIKFVLQNKAGWKERNEVSGDPANPLAIIMDRIALSAKDPLDYDE
jgi:hypothetical protein